VILEPKKIKSIIVSTFSPSICHDPPICLYNIHAGYYMDILGCPAHPSKPEPLLEMDLNLEQSVFPKNKTQDGPILSKTHWSSAPCPGSSRFQVSDGIFPSS